ncbi:hypothetical protein DPEC_G00303090 [Dallia pectoralis]|uniref:Uncharacterized protein n=1 Tax=Dallia pectoralis TaxID=75939 RepID=A0ACC2FGW8_DALPE|nr:hypothetical protein DPEC_G00303090 [Dallia pectoralis]
MEDMEEAELVTDLAEEEVSSRLGAYTSNENEDTLGSPRKPPAERGKPLPVRWSSSAKVQARRSLRTPCLSPRRQQGGLFAHPATPHRPVCYQLCLLHHLQLEPSELSLFGDRGQRHGGHSACLSLYRGPISAVLFLFLKTLAEVRSHPHLFDCTASNPATIRITSCGTISPLHPCRASDSTSSTTGLACGGGRQGFILSLSRPSALPPLRQPPHVTALPGSPMRRCRIRGLLGDVPRLMVPASGILRGP